MVTKLNSPWFSQNKKRPSCANALAKLQKYQKSKALVYFLMESTRHSKLRPSKTKSIHKHCVVTSLKNFTPIYRTLCSEIKTF